MKISLITVSFNAVATIAEAMRSVWEQTRPEGVSIDYLVIDGGSTDGTADQIRSFEQRVRSAPVSSTAGFAFRWVSERDRGLYDAMNKGVRMASGDVIGILNADDRLEDSHVLADVADAFAPAGSASATAGPSGPSPVLDAIYGDVRFVRGAGTQTVRYYSSKRWRPWMHNWGFMPAHPSVYARRTVFEKFGAYKLGYRISADFEWMTRIFCRGKITVRYLPRCFVTMRLGGASTAGLKALLQLNRENVRANRENGYFCCLAMMLPKYLFKIWGYVFKPKGRN